MTMEISYKTKQICKFSFSLFYFYIESSGSEDSSGILSSFDDKYTGLYTFSIVTASLLVVLLASFLFAWLCKWKFLMDAAATYKPVTIHENHHSHRTMITSTNSTSVSTDGYNNNTADESYVAK